jgi:hypothetical protein
LVDSDETVYASIVVTDLQGIGQRLSLPSMIYLEKELLNFYGDSN